MATIHSLSIPHFLKLSPESRMNLIRDLRTARRIVKEKPKPKRAASARTSKRKTVLTGELAGLSQEQLQTLMELMNAND